MDRKISAALIYKNNYNFFNKNHFDQTTNDFFMKALNRNERLQISYFPCENEFDVKKLNGKYDIILLANNRFDATPEILHGIRDSTIPVITKTGDPHHAEKYNQIELHEKFKIDAYWSLQPKEYFFKHYPKNFRFKEILWGIEPTKFENLKPYNERIYEKILNSGNVGRSSIKSKIGQIISKDINSAAYFYKLRTMCNNLSYIDYSGMKGDSYINENYSEYLSKYQAAIATGTFYPVIKFFEIPSAGCLTFMEITEKNHGQYLGFKDNENAIFINEKNYQRKFEEYLSDPKNNKWSEIANAGREYTLKVASNDKGVESLVDLMEEFIK
ncbi:MAG: hypothetical protein H8E89_00380 [Candidatus Nitrosopelagicus sp.]|nr:hypothetical protein [Candidatus Nitrosopelagicus sp.]